MTTNQEQADQRVMVKASPQRCFEVATDFESYPEWSSAMQKVEVLDSDAEGRATRVAFWAEAMGRSTRFVLAYDYSQAPDILSWHMTEGDIEKELDGQYRFEQTEGGTELVFRLSVQLQVSMPGFLRRRAEARILGAAVEQLKTRAES